jgi:hypothetical protein
MSNLSRQLKPLAATLADIANDDGTSIYPSVEYVAWRLSSSERSVREGLSKLRRLGVLHEVAKGGFGPTSTTEYRLIEAKLPFRPPWHRTKKGAESAPFLFDKGAKNDRRRVQSATPKGANYDQNPESILIDPSVEKQTSGGETLPASPARDPRHRPFVEFATETFRTKHDGHAPAWYGKDYRQLAELLKRNADLHLDELKRRWMHYVSSLQPFIRDQGDSLAFFCSRFDSFIDGPLFATPGGRKANADERDHANLVKAGFQVN